jgi:hypothetical protein
MKPGRKKRIKVIKTTFFRLLFDKCMNYQVNREVKKEFT